MTIIDKAAAAYAAMKARFHGGNVHGEPYKDPVITHSLGGRGGLERRDMNGNLLDKHGKVIGRVEAFYGGGGGFARPAKGFVQNCGAWDRLYGGAYRPGD